MLLSHRSGRVYPVFYVVGACLLGSCSMPYAKFNTAGALDNVGKVVHVSKGTVKSYYRLDDKTYGLVDTYRAYANEPVCSNGGGPYTMEKARMGGHRPYRLVDGKAEPYLICFAAKEAVPAAQFDYGRAVPCGEPRSYRPENRQGEDRGAGVYMEESAIPAERTPLNKGLKAVKVPLAGVDVALTGVCYVGEGACLLAAGIIAAPFAAAYEGVSYLFRSNDASAR